MSSGSQKLYVHDAFCVSRPPHRKVEMAPFYGRENRGLEGISQLPSANTMIKLLICDLNSVCLILEIFFQLCPSHLKRDLGGTCLLKYIGCALVKTGPEIIFITNLIDYMENLLKNLA